MKADACAAQSDLLRRGSQRAWHGVIARAAGNIAAHRFQSSSLTNAPHTPLPRGEIAKFESTPGKTERGFCARCGSTLTCETVGLPTLTDFHVGAFDDAELFRPTRHIFPDERLPWLHLADT